MEDKEEEKEKETSEERSEQDPVKEGEEKGGGKVAWGKRKKTNKKEMKKAKICEGMSKEKLNFSPLVSLVLSHKWAKETLEQQ